MVCVGDLCADKLHDSFELNEMNRIESHLRVRQRHRLLIRETKPATFLIPSTDRAVGLTTERACISLSVTIETLSRAAEGLAR